MVSQKFQKKDDDSIFLVIPAYQEGTILRFTLAPLIQLGYSIVVVDDGSLDNTWEIISSLPLHALRHPINLGQGAALQTGMNYALRCGARIIVHFDADGQHRLQDIESLIQPIQEGVADVVLGSRFLRFQDKEHVPRPRRILLKVAIIVNGLMTGLWLSDAHNGLRALSRGAAEKIHLQENGYAHASEIVQQIHRLKLRYVERPTKIHYSRYSRSKGQSFWNAFNIVIDIMLRGILK